MNGDAIACTIAIKITNYVTFIRYYCLCCCCCCCNKWIVIIEEFFFDWASFFWYLNIYWETKDVLRQKLNSLHSYYIFIFMLLVYIVFYLNHLNIFIAILLLVKVLKKTQVFLLHIHWFLIFFFVFKNNKNEILFLQI